MDPGPSYIQDRLFSFGDAGGGVEKRRGSVVKRFMERRTIFPKEKGRRWT